MVLGLLERTKRETEWYPFPEPQLWEGKPSLEGTWAHLLDADKFGGMVLQRLLPSLPSSFHQLPKQ